jgi:alpha-glucosidase
MMSTPNEPRPWWRDAVFYQVYPRSFADTNGDGEGDLPGITAHLDHLVELGANALWLSPFYTSPMADGGYDVADPRAVDPRFGTLADFRDLVEDAHVKNLKVLVDVVPNHFSVEHEWFKVALLSSPGSLERARFHFRPGKGPTGTEPPNNWISVFGGSAWTRIVEPDGSLGEWYLHLFDSSQPDLNWENIEVRADYVNTLKFWLDLGVDGFRVDVAFGLAKEAGLPDHRDPQGLVDAIRLDLTDGSPEAMALREYLVDAPFFDRPEVADIYREWRTVLDAYPGDRMAVAEAWVHPPERALKYVGGDTLHQIFNFNFLVAPWDAADLKEAIDQTLRILAPANAPATWVLNNHDTARVVSRLGGDDLALQQARALALVAQALPGSLYIYQGEELGLADADLPAAARQDPVFIRTQGKQLGRDGGRVPLPWSGASPPYGFSPSGSAPTWLPQPQDWADKTVAAEGSDEYSTLSLYRHALHIRGEHSALGEGDGTIRWLAASDDVLAFAREPGFVAIANTSAAPRTVELTGTLLLSSGVAPDMAADAVTVPAHTTIWLQV